MDITSSATTPSVLRSTSGMRHRDNPAPLPLVVSLNCVEDCTLEQESLDGVALVHHVSLSSLGDGRIEAASAVLLHSLSYLPRAVQRRLSPYQLILCLGSSDRAVDSALAADLGLRVVHVDVSRAEEIADTVMALFLGLLRRTHLLSRHALSASGWLGSVQPLCRGMRRCRGLVLGIVGRSASARSLASRSLAFKMSVLYYDIVEENGKVSRHSVTFPPAVRRMDTLNDLLAASDLISLHCTLTNETIQIINAECLQHIKPGAFLVNTGSSQLLDDCALKQLLIDGTLAGCALDGAEGPQWMEAWGVEVWGVIENAQVKEMPNVLILPRSADYSEEVWMEIREKAISMLQTFFCDGVIPKDAISDEDEEEEESEIVDEKGQFSIQEKESALQGSSGEQLIDDTQRSPESSLKKDTKKSKDYPNQNQCSVMSSGTATKSDPKRSGLGKKAKKRHAHQTTLQKSDEPLILERESTSQREDDTAMSGTDQALSSGSRSPGDLRSRKTPKELPQGSTSDHLLKTSKNLSGQSGDMLKEGYVIAMHARDRPALHLSRQRVKGGGWFLDTMSNVTKRDTAAQFLVVYRNKDTIGLRSFAAGGKLLQLKNLSELVLPCHENNAITVTLSDKLCSENSLFLFSNPFKFLLLIKSDFNVPYSDARSIEEWNSSLLVTALMFGRVRRCKAVLDARIEILAAVGEDDGTMSTTSSPTPEIISNPENFSSSIAQSEGNLVMKEPEDNPYATVCFSSQLTPNRILDSGATDNMTDPGRVTSIIKSSMAFTSNSDFSLDLLPVNKPHFFNGANYAYWKNKMIYFIQASDMRAWNIIEDIYIKPSSEGDTRMFQLNSKAIHIIFCALGPDEYGRVSSCTTANEIWDKLQVTHEGTDEVKESKISLLTHSYENFKLKPDEDIKGMTNRFSTIVNGLKSYGEIIPNEKFLRKLVYSLPKSWQSKKTTIIEAKNLKSLTLEVLIDSLLTHEMMLQDEVDLDKIYETPMEKEKKKNVGVALKSTKDESDLDEDDDEEEMPLFAKRFRKLMRPNRGRKFKRNEGFKTEPKEKDPIICYEYKKLGHVKYDCPQLKKNGQSKKKHKAHVATWSDEEGSDEEEQEVANLCLMTFGENSKEKEHCYKARETNSNSWYLDSGCSRHMTGDKSRFIELNAKNGGEVTFGDNSKCHIEGIDIIGIININDVVHDVEEPSSKEETKDEETQDPLENPTIEEREVSYPREYNYVKDGEIIEPKNIKEALNDEHWIMAMQEELNQFERSKIWTLIERPSNKSIVGYSQEEDIDYDETYAPVARMEAIRIAFEMSMMGELSFFLGLQIKQRKDDIFINQAKYFKDMLKKFGLENGKPHATPMSSSTKLDKDEGGKCVDDKFYRFQSCPKESHLLAVKRIFRYLKDTHSLGLWYPRYSSFSFHTFSDADYGGCKLDRKSTFGCSCCAQVLWMKQQYFDYGIEVGGIDTPLKGEPIPPGGNRYPPQGWKINEETSLWVRINEQPPEADEAND
ncbi:C-terminal binding protein AN [Hibiscus syriacus]|uniref:C-terminal binding protein AN n=1 Tax=Hibiscus syriacus TaxID=106335 RepID=A0A6A2WVS2_HIBSY|nr:C-terminal binding protein AN [Hibiscus syriacus]